MTKPKPWPLAITMPTKLTVNLTNVTSKHCWGLVSLCNLLLDLFLAFHHLDHHLTKLGLQLTHLQLHVTNLELQVAIDLTCNRFHFFYTNQIHQFRVIRA